MHQQPPGTNGIAVENIAVFVRADVHAVNVQLAVFDRTVRVFQIQRALTDGFDLRAAQLDAGFVARFDEIIMARFAVDCCSFCALFIHGRHLLDPKLLFYYIIKRSV